VVHIATGPWLSGLETHNTDHHSAAVRSSVPAAPVLAAEAVWHGWRCLRNADSTAQAQG